jgi:hypothetical protein
MKIFHTSIWWFSFAFAMIFTSSLRCSLQSSLFKSKSSTQHYDTLLKQLIIATLQAPVLASDIEQMCAGERDVQPFFSKTEDDYTVTYARVPGSPFKRLTPEALAVRYQASRDGLRCMLAFSADNVPSLPKEMTYLILSFLVPFKHGKVIFAHRALLDETAALLVSAPDRKTAASYREGLRKFWPESEREVPRLFFGSHKKKTFDDLYECCVADVSRYRKERIVQVIKAFVDANPWSGSAGYAEQGGGSLRSR